MNMQSPPGKPSTQVSHLHPPPHPPPPPKQSNFQSSPLLLSLEATTALVCIFCSMILGKLKEFYQGMKVQETENKASRICMKFSSIPKASVRRCPNPLSPPHFPVVPFFTKNISTFRSGSTE